MDEQRSHLKYFLYVRRSQDAEDRQVASLEDQCAEMQLVAKRLRLTVVDIIEESRSAKRPGRPAFNEMMARIEAGEANAILCWKLDRLARNPIDGGRVQWLLQSGIIQHIQTHAAQYRPTDNMMVMAVELGIANQYVRDLSDNVRRSLRQKAERGWNPQRCLPPGYRHNKEYKEKGGPEILSTPDLPVAKQLLEYFLAGNHSIADVDRKAKALGLRNKQGNPYSYNAIRNLLEHPMYMGSFRWRGEDGTLLLHRGNHEAILTEAQYRKIQLLLGAPRNVPLRQRHEFTFRGPLSCGECGCPITAEHKLQCICTGCKHKFSCKNALSCPQCHLEIAAMQNPTIFEKTYYHCTRTRKDYRCQQGGVEEQVLKDVVASVLRDLQISPSFYQWAKLALQTIHEEDIGEREALAKETTKKSDDLQARLDRLVVMRADSEISAEQFAAQKAKTEAELAAVDGETKQLSDRSTHWAEILDGYLTFAATAYTVFAHCNDMNVQRELVQTFGSNLVIIDKKPRITLLKPISALKNAYVLTALDLGQIEPGKAVASPWYSAEKAAAFSVLLTELRKLRTLIIESDHCFLPSYCRPVSAIPDPEVMDVIQEVAQVRALFDKLNPPTNKAA